MFAVLGVAGGLAAVFPPLWVSVSLGLSESLRSAPSLTH